MLTRFWGRPLAFNGEPEAAESEGRKVDVLTRLTLEGIKWLAAGVTFPAEFKIHPFSLHAQSRPYLSIEIHLDAIRWWSSQLPLLNF